jgi:hypothetical protein
MTVPELPSERQLLYELNDLCGRIGYRIGGVQKSLERLPGLIGLTITGGPTWPDGAPEWHDRREALRFVLRDIAENEVADQLGQQYSEAAIKVFRLDAERPLEPEAHRPLSEIQAPLDERFGRYAGAKTFQNQHRPLLFGVIARSLLAREKEVATREGLKSSNKQPEPNRVREVTPSAEPKKPTVHTNLSGDRQSEQKTLVSPQRRQQLDETKAPHDLSATQLDRLGNQPKRPEKSDYLKIIVVLGSLLAVPFVLMGLNAVFEHGLQQGRHVAPIEFSVQIERWFYKTGNFSTTEAQIKIKPRFVNESPRPVDLRPGGNARLALAIYLPYPPRQWLSSTRPRYRRVGHWLLVPPKPLNTQGLSHGSYKTDLTREFLGPFESYFEPSRSKGDFVFDVLPSLNFTNSSPRLAYRRPDGSVYFPPGGAFRSWSGYQGGMTF